VLPYTKLMKKTVVVLFLAFAAFSAGAQTTGTLKGKLVDSLLKQSIKDAAVSLLDAEDSTLEIAGLSKTDGLFEVLNISFGKYLVRITFLGYEPVYKQIIFSKTSAEYNMGTVYLKQDLNDLGNVTVTQSPITIKKDTIEYNASSLKQNRMRW
jgi:hypothetical protein